MSTPRQTRWEQAQVELGLCGRCRAPRKNYARLCDLHAKEQKLRMRARRKPSGLIHPWKVWRGKTQLNPLLQTRLEVSQLPITGINYSGLPQNTSGITPRTFPDFVTPNFFPASFQISPLEMQYLFMGRTLGILNYLAKAEEREQDVWLRDDYRIAWLCVLFASRNYADPWRYAFWHYLGRTPERIIPDLVARTAKHAAMQAGAPPTPEGIPAASSTQLDAPLPPKKPSHSVKRPPPWKKAARATRKKTTRSHSP
jgi:hypothetical protein